MDDAERTFIEEIDCRFPYSDLVECKALIDRGITISSNAAFFVLHEIARPPSGVKISLDRLLELVGYWSSRFDHPAADSMREVAIEMIHGKSMSVDDVGKRMEALEKYPAVGTALDILYFASDDVDGRLEPIDASIRERWRKQNLNE
jgi:hypothetical protein